MSVYCRVGQTPLLMKALSSLCISKDGWATAKFLHDCVVLHVESADQSATAVATLPRNLFLDFSIAETEFCVHVPTLLDALLMLGPNALQPSAGTTVVLAYPSGDGELLVELTPSVDGGGGAESTSLRRKMQCSLITRPAQHGLLDLQFRNAPLLAQVTLQGEAVREAVADIGAMNCTESRVQVRPSDGVRLRGAGGSLGGLEVCFGADSNALLSADRINCEAGTHVSTAHLALACGARSGGQTSSGGSKTMAAARRALPRGGDPFLNNAVTSSSSTAAVQTWFGGFERLTLQINAQGQLSVMHTQRDHNAVKVTVTVEILPLRDA